jgi:hypothetical protein
MLRFKILPRPRTGAHRSASEASYTNDNFLEESTPFMALVAPVAGFFKKISAWHAMPNF